MLIRRYSAISADLRPTTSPITVTVALRRRVRVPLTGRLALCGIGPREGWDRGQAHRELQRG